MQNEKYRIKQAKVKYMSGIFPCFITHEISDQRTVKNFFVRCPPFESYFMHKNANLLNAGGPPP
jgi:hypothetical protein